MKVLVATRSAHKLREIQEILGAVAEDLELLGLDEAGIAPSPAEADLEPYATFLENAASKAHYFREASGLPTIADDSGLEVEALAGAPGVRSKRFAPDRGLEGLARDQANNRHLVESLRGVPPERRQARYVCEAVLVDEGGQRSFRGEAPGFILETEQGEGGFGYDPLFYDPDVGTTFACLDRAGKNARSHRGKAFRALAAHLGASSELDPR